MIANGKRALAEIIADKLLPLSVGEHLKSLEIGENYLKNLLISRMFKNDKEKEKKAEDIAKKLCRGYTHHGYCITTNEAKSIGLKIEEPSDEEWNIIWGLHEIYRKVMRSIEVEEEEGVEKILKRLKK